MDKETLIQVDQVSRYYANHCAVDNISFAVKRGEVLGFLGPNGAGKTTTMQMISGVLAPSAGAISVAGNDIIESGRAAKKHIGYLPEQPPLYPELSVDEYLSYAGRLRKLESSNLVAAIKQCKLRCGLDDCGNRLIKNLSRGYQQRVGIAQAIIHSPAVLIFDEPTSGLDPIQIREIRQLICELGKDHSVILSTHILPEVQSICDRVLIIHQGQIVLDRFLSEMQQADNIGGYKIAFQRPPAPETIKSIPGISNVQPLDENHFTIQADQSEVLDKLLQKSLNSCWGLTELVPITNSLEELFIQLTQSDLPVADPGDIPSPP